VPRNPFGFLLDIPDSSAISWLRSYLRGESTDPKVAVPADVDSLSYLLGRVHPLGDAPLPRKVGTLAATLLSEAVGLGLHRSGRREDSAFVSDLFTLVEALPLSEAAAATLNDLATAGRLLGGDDPDFHLHALRALVLHQRPQPGEIRGYVEFWRRQAENLRHAPTAIQGLLRISAPAAIEMLPDFVTRARAATPPVPLINTLFAVAAELGLALELWKALRRVFNDRSVDLEAVREALRGLRVDERQPEVWAVLEAPDPQPGSLPTDPEPIWAMRYESPRSERLATARQKCEQEQASGRPLLAAA